jgi:hypothetical protein
LIESPLADLDNLFVELWDEDQLLFPDALPGFEETLFPDGPPSIDDMPLPLPVPNADGPGPGGEDQARLPDAVDATDWVVALDAAGPPVGPLPTRDDGLGAPPVVGQAGNLANLVAGSQPVQPACGTAPARAFLAPAVPLGRMADDPAGWLMPSLGALGFFPAWLREQGLTRRRDRGRGGGFHLADS